MSQFSKNHGGFMRHSIKYGTCTANILQEVDEFEDEMSLICGCIESTSLGFGHGTVVLEKMKKLSKKLGLPIKLQPYARYGDHERLKNWYKRNGFIEGEHWFFYDPKLK